MLILSPVYPSKDLSDKDLLETLIYITELMDSDSNLNLSVDKKTPRIIFKIKKYYIIFI